MEIFRFKFSQYFNQISQAFERDVLKLFLSFSVTNRDIIYSICALRACCRINTVARNTINTVLYNSTCSLARMVANKK